MKRTAYPKYKASGVEWLGVVPEHWEVKRLRFLGSALIGLTYSPDDVVDEDFVGEKYLVLRSTNIQDGKISLHDNVYVTTKVDEELKVRKWDIVICARNGSRQLVGKNALIDADSDKMTFGAFTTVFRSRSNRFLFFYFASHQFQHQSIGFLTTTINQLTNENLKSILATLPPHPEQQAIAAYLDTETGRIDALIAKKQRLQELLKERRSALISHAVTKGLNANVKMQPSEMVLLKEIPEHWNLKKLKFISLIHYGIGEPPEYVEEGTLLIRATNINAGKIETIGLVKVDPKDIPFSRIVWLKKGDIIVVRSGAYTGDSAIIPEEYAGSIAGFDLVISCFDSYPKFVAYGLLSRYLKDDQIFLQKTRAAQPHLNAEDLGDCLIALPPLPEQQAIAAYLDRETAKIDALSTKVEEVIVKLKEYRTALISAAVTGKIDVREAG